MAKKKVAAAPVSMGKKSSASKKQGDPLIETRPKAFGIGGALPPKKDLTRYVKWPRYVRLQRQRTVLCKRLKVPPSLNQFSKTLDRNAAESVLKLALKYRPEDKAAKKERLLGEAEAAKSGKTVSKSKPVMVSRERAVLFGRIPQPPLNLPRRWHIGTNPSTPPFLHFSFRVTDARTNLRTHQIKYGINHITNLVETKKAKLVVIAHDVDPVELVVWLPALCKKMDVPYCIIKGKARLGSLVHKKNATAIAFTAINNEDQREFNKIVETVRPMYNESSGRIAWGGGIMGVKSQAMMAKRQKALDKELGGRMALA